MLHPRDTAPRRRRALAAIAAAAVFGAVAPAFADPLSDATVAVQAVEPTADDRARVSECSGALIAPDLVLTAGHCLDGASGPSRVAVFAYRAGKVVPKPLVAAAIARHPDHVAGWQAKPGDPETRQREIAADLALIRLPAPVDGARPLTFADAGGASGAIAGVGAEKPRGRSGAMKRTELSGVRASTGSGAKVAFASPARLVCGGDSGGPVAADAGSGALWGVVAAVLRPSGGCGLRIAIAPVDPASDGFARMRAAVGAR